MPADQLEFAGFLPPAPSRAGLLPATVKAPRTIVVDEDCRPKRKRKNPEPTPEQARKRTARERLRRDRRAVQWAECCGRSYHRTRACHTWWTTCLACKQPLTWPRW